ncbi:MAG TPA: hypothetical protein VKB51_04665 [bacterium]|nr:hypothetical protein [bacterium]
MFGQKQAVEGPPPLLEREARLIAHLNKEAYGWLGKRYEWYNKIRTAKKGGFKLFSDASLEEQMEATRSALNLVSKTLNGSLGTAYNGVIDAVHNSGTAPEGWPGKQEGDRTDPPPLTEQQDAVILGWMPLKFFNLARPVRDKGKGLDFYSDGLIKKLYFKVIAYFCDPYNWDPARLGYFLTGLEPDADLSTVQGKLGSLRTEVELLSNSLQLFKFGRVARRPEAGQKNAIDELFQISDEELLQDLYFQSLLYSGLEHFVVRYYLVLLGATTNIRALHQLSQIFHPLLAKVVELHLRFQTSFATERDKIRLRKEFLEYYKAREALPPVETIQEKGREVRRINYNHRLIEMHAYSRHHEFGERQAQVWAAYLKREVLGHLESTRGQALLLEVLNTLVEDTQAAMEGKVRAAKDLRDFADEQEKLGRLQIAQKKKALDEAKRNKRLAMGKFRSQEQMNMVDTIQKELEVLEAQGQEQLAQMEQAIAKRREQQLARVEQLELAAKTDREKNQGKNAAALYALARRLDADRALRSGLVAYLVHHVQEGYGESMPLLYKNLFSIFGDLAPTEKMMLRSAVAQKIPLQPEELQVSEEELQSYQQQILARKTELSMELPGILDQRLALGPVKAKVQDLLDMGLNAISLRLLFNLPFAAPNKPANKLPGEAVKKLLLLNQLTHPLPEHDIILPNVEATAPVMKRVNFNRLQKLMA